MRQEIICRVLTGPTASGKTAYAIRLAQQENLDILCMDSMQIYKRMDIGTAKPTREEMCGISHSLIDICEPTDTFSVSDYRDAAEKLVMEKHKQGREILFVGGTLLYLHAMIHPDGMGMIPANEALRSALNQEAQTDEGRKRLHERLQQIDPETARKLPVNDVRRIIRAIEVWEGTGIPFSQQPKREVTDNNPRFRWKVAATLTERQVLYERINRRVSDMIRKGLKEEVEGLILEGVTEKAQSMQGIGYKEMIPCIHGLCTQEEAADRIRTGTRHYAKRQMTFLRREENIQYVRTDLENAYDEFRRILI